MKTGFSILHVEDDVNDVYFVSRALRGSGVELPLNVVPDGQAAIDFLDQVEPDESEPEAQQPGLVILDLNLPHKSGLEVLRWIRHESRRKTIVVIILTSSTSEADMRQAYALGANSYVLKPSDATKLRDFGQVLKNYWLEWNQMPPVERGT